MKSVLAAVLLLSLVPLVSYSAAGSGQDLIVRIDGRRLVDGAGREVILRGVNAGGRSKLPPFYPFEAGDDFDAALDNYADSIQNLGFNVVRLLVIYEGAEPTRGQYDEQYLQIYDKMVAAFAERNIRVIVDAHQDIFNRHFAGDGFPDWSIQEKYLDRPRNSDARIWNIHYFFWPVLRSFDRLYNNDDDLQQSYAEFFGMLAERYKDQPAVIGFEPINEPMPGFEGWLYYPGFYKKLNGLYERVGKAVHQADSRYLIFADIPSIENTMTVNPWRHRPKVDNLVLAPHYYDLGTFGKAFSKGGDKWMMKLGIGSHVALARHWKVPVLLTEFGISPLIKSAPDYVKELYDVFDDKLLSGTFWEASMSATIWNGENTSLFNPDGSVRPASYALDRPYPEAVAGDIDGFSYNPQTGEFRLTWDEDPNIAAPTLVRLPARVYGEMQEVYLSGGSCGMMYDKAVEILRIDGCCGGGRREVVALPAK